MNKKIIVGLSGGVDSSMSLLLLKKQGWQPVGVTLRLPVWRGGNRFADNLCCQPQNLTIAQKLCQQLKIPYFIIDTRKEFLWVVVDYFLKQLHQGSTPNPCVICNQCLKFKKLLAVAKKMDAKYIATGHYARTRKIKNYQLLMAKDKTKDQSYYLSFLPKKWLTKIVFPLGEYTKDEVYELAKEAGLNFWQEKKQSQDFCYLGGQKLTEYVTQTLKPKPGAIIDTDSNRLGRHQGLVYYTLGQRKKIGLGGGPYYVQGFNRQKNYLIVTKDKKKLYKKELMLKPYNLFMSSDKPLKVKARVRYQQPLQEAVIYVRADNLKLIFEESVFAAAPGQICAFYENEVCLGGGVIVK